MSSLIVSCGSAIRLWEVIDPPLIDEHPPHPHRPASVLTDPALTVCAAERVLPLDPAAARHHAELTVAAKKRRLPLPYGYMATIAAPRGYAIASRDSAPFKAAGLRVLNPWRR